MQYQLRVQGQKARYLKAAQVAEMRAAIERGKQLKQLEREQQRLRAKMAQLVANTAELGLELPD
ncbi:hypothetical protein H6F80_15005 [Leptolyngbya sp. FACHB-711]|uniref:hypothetical protein n=1 Tax=Leptolyngbya sp. GB1-A1 TaxID=2933908 RepID=UPI0016890624|nr:hypothetical protein [Leptolyngbya sp. FACHB-711]